MEKNIIRDRTGYIQLDSTLPALANMGRSESSDGKSAHIYVENRGCHKSGDINPRFRDYVDCTAALAIHGLPVVQFRQREFLPVHKSDRATPEYEFSVFTLIADNPPVVRRVSYSSYGDRIILNEYRANNGMHPLLKLPSIKNLTAEQIAGIPRLQELPQKIEFSITVERFLRQINGQDFNFPGLLPAYRPTDYSRHTPPKPKSPGFWPLPARPVSTSP